jgi:hypothetical protein
VKGGRDGPGLGGLWSGRALRAAGAFAACRRPGLCHAPRPAAGQTRRATSPPPRRPNVPARLAPSRPRSGKSKWFVQDARAGGRRASIAPKAVALVLPGSHTPAELERLWAAAAAVDASLLEIAWAIAAEDGGGGGSGSGGAAAAPLALPDLAALLFDGDGAEAQWLAYWLLARDRVYFKQAVRRGRAGQGDAPATLQLPSHLACTHPLPPLLPGSASPAAALVAQQRLARNPLSAQLSILHPRPPACPTPAPVREVWPRLPGAQRGCGQGGAAGARGGGAAGRRAAGLRSRGLGGAGRRRCRQAGVGAVGGGAARRAGQGDQGKRGPGRAVGGAAPCSSPGWPAPRGAQRAARSPQLAARSAQRAARSPQPAARSAQPAARSAQPAALGPRRAARSAQRAACL